MAAVYSKSFFWNTVVPGTPLSFMVGPASETWIVRSMLFTQGSGAFGWSVVLTDNLGNTVYDSGLQSVNSYVAQPTRLVLPPASNITVSAGAFDVFVAIDGYVLSA